MNDVVKNDDVHDAVPMAADFMLGLNELKARAGMVSQIKQQIMVRDKHYGVVPGCGEKPTLLKNGAELLCMAFKLASDAKVNIADLGNGHREYTVTTTLTSIVTGTPIATGLGSCSTLESKYRYRGCELEPTGKPVPQNYWDNRDVSLLGGKGFVAKKDDSGKWMIFAKGEKKENPDIADVYNTVLKMASKRSFVDATLKATGGSCEFTQDVEDNGFGGNNSASDYGAYDNYPSQEYAEPHQAEVPKQQKKAKRSQSEKDENWKNACENIRKKNPQVFDSFLKNRNVTDIMQITNSNDRANFIADVEATIQAAMQVNVEESEDF